jgi:aspartate racemase
MEQDFYRGSLRHRGVDVVISDENERNYVQNVIYRQLCAGKLLAESSQALRKIILDLECEGAQAVVLACTELLC